MGNKRELVIKQIELQHKIQSLAKVNIVTCGNCGSVNYHELEQETIECFDCMEVMAVCDCPDFWYAGVENNREFAGGKLTEEISVADVINVAESIGMNVSVYEITQVLNDYDSEVKSDENSSWREIVENLLYRYLTK
jgi:hypothetical protein